MDTPRSIRPEDRDAPRPIYAVWEITLRCDQSCEHCGSRAGPVREDELSTEELFEVADALVRLGTREITLIGGEAYLRGDVYKLIEHIAKQGPRVTMQTGGRGLTPDKAKRLRAAGLSAIGVSIDGLEATHDTLRGSKGSQAAALRAVENGRAAGMVVTSNSQINRLNMHELRDIAAMLEGVGVAVWRAQLTAAMGRAGDHPDWILQPYMVLDVIDTLAEIQNQALERARAKGLPPGRGFHVALGNNLGYFGPHESLLRSRPGKEARHFSGCQAGQYVMGIESDGTIKGCPSLPTAPYTGGNVRTMTLEDIWRHGEAMKFTRDRTVEELWGFCRTCYYADICRAGCSFTTHSALGRRGNNPFCYYRAATLKKQGVREELVHAMRPPGDPYDFGRFELREAPWSDAPPDDVAPTNKRSLAIVT